MRLLIVGAGAVGGYFGALLADAGRDVTFLVRPARAESLRNGGLRIVGARSLHVDPQLAIVGAIDSAYDAILLAVKAYSLDDALRDVTPAVGSATMIVPLLNGMRHIDVLVERFGEERVLGGVSALASTLDADGAIRWLSRGAAVLRYGERRGGMSARVEALDDAVRLDAYDASASSDIMGEMWRKWTMLGSMGAVNCLLRGSIGEIEAAGGASIAVQLLEETSAVVTAAGYAPTPDEAAGLRALMTTPASHATTSMYRDLRNGNRVEGEHIVGDLVDRARRFGIATPLLEAARVALRVYEQGR